jgi:hypothetical protein
MAKNYTIQFSRFFQGLAPLAHIDSLTELGNKGHASSMTDVDTLSEVLMQGPSLTALTNGTQAEVVDQLIAHISDRAVADNVTYGIGTTKLFKISSTAVIDDATWPVTITGAVAGRSVVYLKGKLFYFFNRSADGVIGTYDLSSSFTHNWQTGLEKADLMPVATKEDIMLFGHGRYVGVYFDNSATMTLDQLDFGQDNEVADVAFFGNQWLVAVNSGISGTNRTSSQIFAYGAGATTALLSDEVSVGLQRIGFIFPYNGVIYVCYQDLSFSGGYKIGYISGKKIEPLVSFTGSLPTYQQKTLYRNTILFPSSGDIYTAGAIAPELPYAISKHASAYSTIGAVAAPFGTPLIASTEDTNYQLSKFSGYSSSSKWESITIPISSQRHIGYIDYVEVFTRELDTGAECDLTIKVNQEETTTTAQSIVPGKIKHRFHINQKDVDDLKLCLEWKSAVACKIRKIVLYGHFCEK